MFAAEACMSQIYTNVCCVLPLLSVAAAGCCMVICTSQIPEDIVEILNGARKGTKFHPLPNSLKGRKRWLLTGRDTAFGRQSR